MSEPKCIKTQWGNWECEPGGQEITVNVGADQWVEIDKLYGPQCSSSIRVKHDFKSCCWIVEEQNFNDDTWVERVRFDAQEFYKHEYLKEEK